MRAGRVLHISPQYPLLCMGVGCIVAGPFLAARGIFPPRCNSR
jgi:hypothetical protein